MTQSTTPGTGPTNISDKNRESDLAEKAKTAASAASENLRTGAREVADSVSTEASNYASQAKDTAADEVKSVASALRTAAHEMRSGSPQERTFSQIADGLADASEAMRDKDLGEIVNDLNGFAKRNPLVFLGSAALIGFAATRFAKATGGGRDSGQSDTYGSHASPDMDRPTPGSNTVQSPAPSGAASGMSSTQGRTTPASPAIKKGDRA